MNIFNEKNNAPKIENKPKMHPRQQVFKIKPSLINEHFQCGICQGYIIDATTITDCLHSFCKSCIVHFLKTVDHRCPTCNSNLKNDLERSIKSDSFLQRLIYKLIPNLLENEIERRDRFYFNENLNTELIISNKTLLNVKLSHYVDKSASVKNLIDFEKENQTKTVESAATSAANTTKYIQCMAQTPVAIISKLIRNKYDIPTHFKIKLTYQGHRLDDSESLIQVYTSFILSKDELLHINYEIKKKKSLLKNIKNTFNVTSSVPVEANKSKNVDESSSKKETQVPTIKAHSTDKVKLPRNSNKISKHTSKLVVASTSATSNYAKTQIFTTKKLQLLPGMIQNENNNNNLLTRYRPIRKKDPVEPAKSSESVVLVAATAKNGKNRTFK